jgi:microcystin-dependent protein
MGQTTNRNYPYPERSDDPDVHADMKALADAVDTDMTTVLPVGSVIAYAGSTPPAGWLLCDGAGFNSTTYPTLAGVLGGAAVTPNLVERFVKGVASRPSTKTGGSKKIEIANMPSHRHGGATQSGNATHSHGGATTTNGSHSHSLNETQSTVFQSGSNRGGLYTTGTAANSTNAEGNHAHYISTDTQNAPHTHAIYEEGGGQDYQQPFYALLYIIKAV